MALVIDTSALIAVLVSEPQRNALVRATEGEDLVAPASVHWEVGNALSAFLRRKRATLSDVRKCLEAYAMIPLRLVEVELEAALDIAARHNIYAYDAYLVACALSLRSPLLTLDQGLLQVAQASSVEVVELFPSL